MAKKDLNAALAQTRQGKNIQKLWKVSGYTHLAKLEPDWVREHGLQVDGATLVEITYESDRAVIRCLGKAEVDALLDIKVADKKGATPTAPAVPKAERVEIVDPSVPTGKIQCDGILTSEEWLGEKKCLYLEGGGTCGRTAYARNVCKMVEADWYKAAGKPMPVTMEAVKPKPKKAKAEKVEGGE